MTHKVGRGQLIGLPLWPRVTYICIYINEGNDVTTAQEMTDVLLSHGGLERVWVTVAESIEEYLPGAYPIFVFSGGGNA